jgi:hypothetical protein
MRRPVSHRPLAWLVVLCAVAGALLAGCGSDDDGPRTLSKREYIERSNDLQADAATVFTSLDGKVATTPAEAKRYLAALDRLSEGLDGLEPPRDWRDEHATMLESVRTMRHSMAIVSKASPRNAKVITRQLTRSSQAQRDYEQAVREINASR